MNMLPPQWRPLAATSRRAALAIAALTLAGCASFSPDGGFAPVERLAAERLGQPPTDWRDAQPTAAVAARVTSLLQQPLTADGAVSIALLNHPALQAAYAELGVAEADWVRAGRPANPSLRFGRLSGGGSVEIDRGVLFDVLGLLTLPLAQQLEQQRLERTQIWAAQQTVGLALQARQAFFEAVAADQLVGYARQVQEAADLAHELARRMVAAGHFSTLDALREQAFQTDAALQLARARQQALAARERLLRALGLAGDGLELQLPPQLPALPAEPLAAQAAEQTAVDRRLDVLAARRDAQATAQALGLTQATRFVNVLQAGYQDSRNSGEPRRRGVEIELELPLFDFGSTRIARAEALYRQAMHRVAAAAAQARSEVREAHAAYRSAYELARRHRDEVLPLRKRIAEQNLLRYNGMFASVFELLADSREQIAATVGAIEALREHWLAETRLQMALAGASPVGAGS